MNRESVPIDDMILESGLDTAEFAEVAEALSTLRTAVAYQSPVPSAELAALLSGAVPARHGGGARPRRAAVASGAVVATLVLGTGAAAASNALPEPAQRVVNELSERYLPFRFPSPEERDQSSPTKPAVEPETVSERTRPDTRHDHHVGNGTRGDNKDDPGKGNGTADGQAGKEKPAKVADEGPDRGSTDAEDRGRDSGSAGAEGGNGMADLPEQAKPTAPPSAVPGRGQGNDNGQRSLREAGERGRSAGAGNPAGTGDTESSGG